MRLLEEQVWEEGVPRACRGCRFAVSILGPYGEWGHSCAYPFPGGQDGIMIKSTGFGGRQSWLQELALSFASCMALYKLLNFTKPWFLHLLNWNRNSTFPSGSL